MIGPGSMWDARVNQRSTIIARLKVGPLVLIMRSCWSRSRRHRSGLRICLVAAAVVL